MDRAFHSMRVEPVTTRIPPDGEERLSQEKRSSSFFIAIGAAFTAGDSAYCQSGSPSSSMLCRNSSLSSTPSPGASVIATWPS